MKNSTLSKEELRKEILRLSQGVMVQKIPARKQRRKYAAGGNVK